MSGASVEETKGNSPVSVSTMPAERRRQTIWQGVRRNLILYLILTPSILGTALFQYYPAVIALYRSFYSWNGFASYFVGLRNFAFFLKDPHLKLAWLNVAKLMGFQVVIILTMPLLCAYAIFRLKHERLRYFYRLLFVIPMIIPGVVITILWRWLLGLYGGINIILESIGLESWTRDWLGDPRTALYALMFVGFPWVGGVAMLIYLSGFMAIPGETLDAAEVDGATGVKRLWWVELPMIQGQIKLQVMLTCIGAIQQFQQQLIMTNGGPGWATMVPGLVMFRAATADFSFGYACSIGMVLFVVIFLLTLINQRYIRGSQMLQ